MSHESTNRLSESDKEADADTDTSNQTTQTDPQLHTDRSLQLCDGAHDLVLSFLIPHCVCCALRLCPVDQLNDLDPYRTGNGLAGTHSGADVIVLQGGVSQRLMPR